MSARRRTALLVPPLALLLAGGPALSARAAEPGSRSEGTVLGADLSVLGAPVGTLSRSDAVGQVLASVLARGEGTGLTGVAASSAVASRSAPGTTRVPEQGQNCATPDLAAAGAPASVASLVVLTAACGQAGATVDDAGPSASGTASGIVVKVSAQALGDALAQLLVPAVNSALSAAQGPVTQASGQLTAAVGTVCAGVPAPANAICTAALGDLQAVAEPTAQQLTTAIAAAIQGALQGVDLLTVTVGGGASSVASTTATVLTKADGTTVTVSSPSLGFLLPAIDKAVAAVFATYVPAVTQALRSSATATTIARTLMMPGLVDQAATAVGGLLTGPVQQAVTTVTDGLRQGVPLLADSAPLLQLAGGAGTATATLDRATGKVDSAGTAGSLVLTLSPSLAALLGVPATTSVAAGQDMTVLAGTPLESRLAVGSSSPASATQEGVTESGTSVEGLTVALLTPTMGGVVVRGGTVTALAGTSAAAPVATPTVAPVPTAAPVATTPPPAALPFTPAPTQLPRTGGLPGALGGAVLLGTGAVLVRRRLGRDTAG